MVDGIATGVVNCVGMDICTEKSVFQRLQRLNFAQAVHTAV